MEPARSWKQRVPHFLVSLDKSDNDPRHKIKARNWPALLAEPFSSFGATSA